jgi:hypothetical protein
MVGENLGEFPRGAQEFPGEFRRSAAGRTSGIASQVLPPRTVLGQPGPTIG